MGKAYVVNSVGIIIAETINTVIFPIRRGVNLENSEKIFCKVLRKFKKAQQPKIHAEKNKVSWDEMSRGDCLVNRVVYFEWCPVCKSNIQMEKKSIVVDYYGYEIVFELWCCPHCDPPHV